MYLARNNKKRKQEVTSLNFRLASFFTFFSLKHTADFCETNSTKKITRFTSKGSTDGHCFCFQFYNSLCKKQVLNICCLFLFLCLKVICDTFLLFCFWNIKESTFETWKCFYSRSKSLFFLQIIEFFKVLES